MGCRSNLFIAKVPDLTVLCHGQRAKGTARRFKPKPNPRQIRASSSKIRPNLSKENPWISFDFLRRIEPYQGLTPTPRAFFLLAPLPASNEATGRRDAARSHGFECRFLGLHFEFVLAFSSEVKGWRLFMIADARALFARPGGRELQEREKGNAGVDEGPLRKKAGRSIRCPARDSPAKEPEPVSGLWTSGRAPALHAASVSRTPLPFDASLPFCRLRCECGRFPSGVLMSAFHQAMDHHDVTPIICKTIVAIATMMVNRKDTGAYRVGGQGRPLNLTVGARPSAGQTAGIEPERSLVIHPEGPTRPVANHQCQTCALLSDWGSRHGEATVRSRRAVALRSAKKAGSQT
jgi:hypothetical protein